MSFCLLLRSAKPLQVEHEDPYRRSRWEDPPHPAHLLRPVSPEPRRPMQQQQVPMPSVMQQQQVPMPSVPHQVAWAMSSNQTAGTQQYERGQWSGYPQAVVQQWHQPGAQIHPQWSQVQMPAMSQGHLACMGHAMGTSFGSSQSNPVPSQQWEHAATWNQLLAQQAQQQASVQNDAMLTDALLAAVAQRQLEMQVPKTEVFHRPMATEQPQARPSPKAAASPPEESQPFFMICYVTSEFVLHLNISLGDISRICLGRRGN